MADPSIKSDCPAIRAAELGGKRHRGWGAIAAAIIFLPRRLLTAAKNFARDAFGFL